MDKNTFGDMPSAVNLMGILDKEENQIYSRRVARILSKYIKQIKALMDIKDKETRQTAIVLWSTVYTNRVKRSQFPILVETHAICVIVGYCRKYLRPSKVT